MRAKRRPGRRVAPAAAATDRRSLPSAARLALGLVAFVILAALGLASAARHGGAAALGRAASSMAPGPLAGAVAALLLNFVGILSAMLLVGALAGGYLLSTTDVAASVGGLQRGLVVVALALPILLVPLILNPRGGPRVAAWVTAAGERLGGRAGGWARRLGSLIDRACADYAASIRMIRGRWWSSLGAGALLSVGMLLNKCAVGLLVGRGLGGGGHY